MDPSSPLNIMNGKLLFGKLIIHKMMMIKLFGRPKLYYRLFHEENEHHHTVVLDTRALFRGGGVSGK